MEHKVFGNKIYGALIVNRSTGKQFEVWFESFGERERYLLTFSRGGFDVVELLGDQMELNFDLR